MPIPLSTSEQISGILRLLSGHSSGLSKAEIYNQLEFKMSSKTLQRRLISLVQSGRLERSGRLKSTRYYFSGSNARLEGDSDQMAMAEDIFSAEGRNDLSFLARQKHFRDKVTYNREFIESYKPNVTFYVPENVRRRLSD